MTSNSNNRSGYVSIIGRPNAGKSTLLNYLVGQKLAITSRKPQTTRHTILGVKTGDQGQIIYVDTPGIHQRGDQAMNKYLNRTAKTMLNDVDLILFVVDAMKWTAEDTAVLELLGNVKAPAILIINKLDQIEDKEQLLPYIQDLSAKHSFCEIIPLSAKTGKNVSRLEKRVIELMPEGENIFPEDQLTDRSERFFAAELVREQLTRRYAKEIPYALTVEIEQFEDVGNMYRIGALVWVEREGQKNIIIGNKGEAMKVVATQARLEMEKLFDKKVHLSVWVKVKKSWSSDVNALARLGYRE